MGVCHHLFCTGLLQHALEWYRYGLEKNDDAIVKFMMHWIAFNWLYSEYRRNSRSLESEAIKEFCKNKYEKLSRFDAFSSPAIAIFLEQPVRDILNGRVTSEGKDRYWSLVHDSGLEQLTSLILTIYHVRCNLFHGSKSLKIDRDVELVRASSIILEGYLREVLKV